ncbi:hypothetical protein [Natranaeroarchaeum aerophilus]|uniref:Uncharacterized protein n=1 Tax=Natranaeroarchaeum aerophilus TaxID=2917711 RepID=A0AAE3FR54_9EURY|nr:hypothetical protein [Natranaeroarchaeum aerophilus]MCL9813348.1 hypothetical protein [Natranaeroarchaeum aerophilus]
MLDNERQRLLRVFRIGFVALLGGGVVANLFREGLTVDAAVTGLGIGIAAVVSSAMIVAVVLLILVIADRWSTRTA